MTKNILIVKGGKYAEAEVSRKTAINVEIISGGIAVFKLFPLL